MVEIGSRSTSAYICIRKRFLSSPPATMNSVTGTPRGGERLDDPAGAERGGLQQRAVALLGPGGQGQPDDGAAELVVHEHRAVAADASRARPARGRRPAGVAARSVRCSWMLDTRRRAPRRSSRPGTWFLTYQAKMSPTPDLPGLVAVAARTRCRRRPPRTCPALLEQVVAVHHVAGRGAHDRDHLAGLDRLGGGRGDVRVDVADRDGDALRQSGPGRRLGGQPAGAIAELRRCSWATLSSAKPAKAGFSAPRKSRLG